MMTGFRLKFISVCLPLTFADKIQVTSHHLCKRCHLVSAGKLHGSEFQLRHNCRSSFVLGAE